MNDKLFPRRPVSAVSAAVFRQGRVLIIRRAQAPLIGHFSLPGGRVEVGETLADALARELMEEVGIEAEIIGLTGTSRRSLTRVNGSGCISSSLRSPPAGQRASPTLSDEADAVDWIDPAGPLPGPTTPELGGRARERGEDRKSDRCR